MKDSMISAVIEAGRVYLPEKAPALLQRLVALQPARVAAHEAMQPLVAVGVHQILGMGRGGAGNDAASRRRGY